MGNIIKADKAAKVTAFATTVPKQAVLDVKPAQLTHLLQDAQNNANSILTRAQQEADIIIRTARADADAIRDQAYAEGYQAGMEQAIQTPNELIARLEADLAQTAIDRDQILAAIEPEVLKLVVETVEKVIRHEVKTNPRIVTRTIKSVLRRVKNVDEAYIRVHPSEVEVVRNMRDELLATAEGLKNIRIADDRRVSAGGCVIETSNGDFDARIETQIDRVQNRLMETYENDRREACAELGEIPASNQPD